MIKKQSTLKIKTLQFTLALLISVFLSACGSTNRPPLKTVESLDKDKFEGEWYVIANIPYFAEKNKVATRTTYKKRGPNRYDDIFTYKEKDFDSEDKTKVGSIKSLNDNNTQWQSTFYWLLKFKFDVLYINTDHSIMLLGHPSRNYGWVMSLNNTVSDDEYTKAMQVFADNEYDYLKFSKVPQLPEQMGKTGFQTTTSKKQK